VFLGAFRYAISTAKLALTYPLAQDKVAASFEHIRKAG
jgi:hypothetical protein